jgi:hypothetical protein
MMLDISSEALGECHACNRCDHVLLRTADGTGIHATTLGSCPESGCNGRLVDVSSLVGTIGGTIRISLDRERYACERSGRMFTRNSAGAIVVSIISDDDLRDCEKRLQAIEDWAAARMNEAGLADAERGTAHEALRSVVVGSCSKGSLRPYARALNAPLALDIVQFARRALARGDALGCDITCYSTEDTVMGLTADLVAESNAAHAYIEQQSARPNAVRTARYKKRDKKIRKAAAPLRRRDPKAGVERLAELFKGEYQHDPDDDLRFAAANLSTSRLRRIIGRKEE